MGEAGEDAFGAVVGVAAVLAAHPFLLTALQVAGGAYLIYLSVRSLSCLWRGRHETTRETGPPVRTRTAAFRQGFLVNASNPKAPVLFLRPPEGR